jgi:hypothetical protein
MDTRSGQPTPPRYFSFSRDLPADGHAESVVELDYLLGQIADLILAGLDAFSLRDPGQPIPPE